jgi:hypothetical protein
MGSGKGMTYDQAVQEIVKLRQQGKTFPEIEAHMKTIGYKSPRTKAPVTHLACRHMFEKFNEKKSTSTVKAEKREFHDEKLVGVKSSASQSYENIVADIQKIIALDLFSNSTKVKIIKALANGEEFDIDGAEESRTTRRPKPSSVAEGF